MSTIQILGYRDDKYNPQVFFSKNTKIDSVSELFLNIEKYKELIPENERWNVHYTLANCKENDRPRVFESSNTIAFDIDDINKERIADYHPVVLRVLGVKKEETGIVMSGNGLHYIIQLQQPIAEKEFYRKNKFYYDEVCTNIDKELELNGLVGNCDKQIFEHARTLRLPLTTNIKKDKEVTFAELIQRVITPVDFNLMTASGYQNSDSHEEIPESAFKNLAIDKQTVLAECEFLKFCTTNQEALNEPQWYSMLTITARMDNGRELSHEMSKNHPGYSFSNCEKKIDHALKTSKPRTCAGINSLWGNCHTCKHFGKANSPVGLCSKDFIKTSKTKFHDLNKSGVPTNPNYLDLMKVFEQKYKYKYIYDTGMFFVYNGKFWETLHEALIDQFTQEHMEDLTSRFKCQEFISLLKRFNTQESSWFNDSCEKIWNFKNGVLDINKMELIPHSPDYGFTSCRDYEYDKNALCPEFDKFLSNITLNRSNLEKVLLEYIGFALSGDEYNPASCLILLGEGSNGKSTFLDIVRDLAGKGSYSEADLHDLDQVTSRYALFGKLFNISSETSNRVFDSKIFKNLSAGESVPMRKLYKDEFYYKNRAKLIMACNSMPRTTDTTHGLLRRMIIIPFDALFEGENDDKNIKDRIRKELPGIMNKMIAAYKEFVGRARVFTTDESSKEAIEEYREEIDSFHSFFSEKMALTGDPESFVGLDLAYDEYRFFSEKTGRQPLSMVMFTKRMKKKIGKNKIERTMVEGVRKKRIYGVKMFMKTERSYGTSF